MKKVLIAIFSALALLMMTSSTANAVANWSANGESEILSPTKVRLQGENTSIETSNLNINVDKGTEITFEYTLEEGALCEAGAPRVFTFVNGTINKSTTCDGTGTGDTSGTASYTTDRAGLITHTGLVYDNGRPGSVVISNLMVDGELVLFTALPPEQITPEAPAITEQPYCEDGVVQPGTLTVPDGGDRVEYYPPGPGEHDAAPGPHVVTAKALEGYVFEEGTQTSFNLIAEDPRPCETSTPTGEPTVEPTNEPTVEPTQEPTNEPEPTQDPTTEPTQEPEPTETTDPTVEPTTTPEPTDDTTPAGNLPNTGDELPDTGVNPWLIALAVFALLAGGAAVITQRVSTHKR